MNKATLKKEHAHGPPISNLIPKVRQKMFSTFPPEKQLLKACTQPISKAEYFLKKHKFFNDQRGVVVAAQ